MGNSRISWFIKNEGKFIAKEEYHAGTYTTKEKIVVEIQAWNNRWGVEDVDSIQDPVLNFHFDTLEDSSLLHLCKVEIDGMGETLLVIREEKASARLGRSLQGRKNNGDEKAINNQGNFVNITFEFDAAEYRLKENDLKNLYFEIVPMN